MTPVSPGYASHPDMSTSGNDLILGPACKKLLSYSDSLMRFVAWLLSFFDHFFYFYKESKLPFYCQS